MKTTRRAAAAAIAVLCALGGAARAEGINPGAAPVFTRAQEAAIERIVANWLARNPDALLRALEAAARSGDPALTHAMDGQWGDPEGDVTIVAFVDRESPASSLALKTLAAMAATDARLRVVIKELPTRSDGSVRAALASAAARMQGAAAGTAFDAALLASAAPADEAALAAAAERARLDRARWEADRMAPAALDYLRHTYEFASAIGVSAAPTFLVGSRALSGPQSAEALRGAVAAERAGSPP